MKKLLSILSIGTILGSSSPMVVACNSTTNTIKDTNKLTFLNNLEIYNINVQKNSSQSDNDLYINPTLAYTNIEKSIIQQYSDYGFKNKLNIDNFVVGDASKLSKTKNWAIQLIDPNSKKVIKNASIGNLKTPSQDNLIKNNALNVVINSNDINVKAKNVTIPAYLNKFVYSNPDLNNGNNVSVDVASTSLTQENVIDITKIKGVILPMLTKGISVANLKTQLLNQNNNPLISKVVFKNFNNKIENETKRLDSLNLLHPMDKKNFPHISQINNLYGTYNNNVGLITQDKLKQSGLKIFAQVNLNLPQNYIGFPNAYCYLYIGQII